MSLSRIETLLAKRGYRLPVAAKPVASYIMCTRVGNLVYTGARTTGLWCTHDALARRAGAATDVHRLTRLPTRPPARPPALVVAPRARARAAGHLPQPAEGPLIVGKVGRELTTEQGYDASRSVVLNILATLKGGWLPAAACRYVAFAARPHAARRISARCRRRRRRRCDHHRLSRPILCARPRTRRRRPTPHATAAELGGDLDKVKRFVKLTAFVNCVDSYTAQPKVANGASDLLGEIFGDAGKHARSAVGVNALPLNVPVEIEGESRRAAPRGAQPARDVRTHAHAKGG